MGEGMTDVEIKNTRVGSVAQPSAEADATTPERDLLDGRSVD